MNTFYLQQRLNKNDCFNKHQQQQPFCLIRNNNNNNEETIQLKGLVAKTRALFENSNNNNNNKNAQIIEQTMITRPNYVLINRVQKQLLTANNSNNLVSLNENDSDKENSTNKMAPFLNQLKPSSKLATKFQIFNNNNNIIEKNTKLILPTINNNRKWLSNQQQQYTTPMYSSSSASSSPPPSSLSSHSFDSHSSNEINNNNRHNDEESTSPSLWQPRSEEMSKELNLPTSVRQAKLCFERNIQKQSSLSNNNNVKQMQSSNNNKIIKSIESPIFSSSSSMSSVPSSPTSSVEISCRFKTVNKPVEEKYVYPHNYKQILVENTTPNNNNNNNNNNKIKILKKNFQNKCNKQGQLVNNINTFNLTKPVVNKEEDKHSNMIPNATIQIKTIKLRQQEPIVSIKSILRNKTPVLDESQISPKLDKKIVADFLEKEQLLKVDQSSCVLPSKMKTNQFVSLNNDDEIKQPIPIKPINNSSSCFKTWQQQGLNSKPQLNLNTNNNNNNNMAKRVSKNAASAKENLLRWCRKHTQSYYNISIDNFSSSWSNGLAFCALIDHFLPGSFDYNQLDPINARRNFELAFKTAEEKAGIVSLLDVDDMIEMGNAPDWKCVFTYIHSIYQKFREVQSF